MSGNSDRIEFGDLVEWQTPDAPKGQAICIGEMAYSTPENRVILLATSATTGMPINVANCERVTGGSIESAQVLRDRYERQYPGRLTRMSESPPSSHASLERTGEHE